MEKIKEIFKEYGYNLSDKQVEQYRVYFEFLVEYNQNVNLTSIVEKSDVMIKHFLDSVLGESLITKNASVVDIGTGAGFPAVPLKILRSDISITLVDSLKKRTVFLAQLLEKLKIKAEVVHARAEDFCTKNREKYDVCVSRAVSQMATLCEYCLPAVSVGGAMIAYKGSSANAELDQAMKAVELLGGERGRMLKYELPNDAGTRHIIEIKKIKKTNAKYPRSKNFPKLSPL